MPAPQALATIIPAAGWTCQYVDPDGKVEQCPLIAWGLDGSGAVVPLWVSDAGIVEAIPEPYSVVYTGFPVQAQTRAGGADGF